tara:strand:- start:2149 stop:3174 length:1026 start_codon:yes stop_codon:yes gene_type:complete
MEDTGIDEIIRRYKPASSTKTKTPKKAKPVSKAKTKNPKVKTKRRSPVGRRINMRGGPLGLEDLINDEQTIRERFKPSASIAPASINRSKTIEGYKKASEQNELQRKFSLPEGVRSGGEYYYDPITGDPMYRPPMPVGKPGVPQAQVLPPPINLITQRPQMMQLKPEESEGITSAPVALTDYFPTGGGGGLFGGGRNLAPELIQRIKEAQEARRATGGGGLFGLIGGGQRTSVPSFQNPFLGQMQMQQPINPIVGFQDESQPKFPDIPQFMQKAAGETFGGYGGLPSIKPIMQYAGMGDSPSAPPTMNKQRPLPRPTYNPDAQPGGPSRPRVDILRRLFKT